MKKLVCFALLLSLCFLFGCSSVDSKPLADEKNESENTSQSINLNGDVILPKVNVESTNLAKEFKNLNLNNFTIVNAIGNTYYGYKSTYSDGGINDEFMLIDSKSGKNEYKQINVAAYCRVSTDSDDQLQSYEAQVEYYTDHICKNPKWHFVGIYADEGITGTVVSKRERFKDMIRDCEKGKIDLILTKSVSRFARNTVDSLNYVRKLKAMNIGVYFEEQNIDTLTTDSEMFIGLYSVMAQSESENISANVKWGVRQRMKNGTFGFNFNTYGYRKGENGEPEVVPEEAEYVKKMFDLYLDGYSTRKIADYLNEQGAITRRGNEWNERGVQRALSNEKYIGDMLMQKNIFGRLH